MNSQTLKPSGMCVDLPRVQVPADTGVEALPERREHINYADRWLFDGLSVLRPPAFTIGVEVDMSHCKRRMFEERALGTKVTYVHMMLRATALALKQHPDLHKFVAGSTRFYPQSVSIALSIADDSFV